MRLTFLISTTPSGAAAEHVTRISARHDAVVGITGARPAGEASIGRARVLPADDVVAMTADVAVALDWQATVRLFEAQAKRFAFWVDGLGYEGVGELASERLVARLAYGLPVDFIAAAPHLQRALTALRPRSRVLLARSGVGEVAGKREKEIAVARFDDPGAVDFDAVLAAMAAGDVPVIVPGGVQEDLVEHGVSGLVAQAEDARGFDADEARLAADSELRERLSSGARAVALQWPDWDAASLELEQALKLIESKPPPEDATWPATLMADAVAIATVQQLELTRLMRDRDDLRVGRSPLRRALRRVKRSRRLTPLRLALRRFVPQRVKRLA